MWYCGLSEPPRGVARDHPMAKARSLNANPRKGEKTVRRAPLHRKTATGMRQDASGAAQNQPAEIAKSLDMGEPGTTG